MTVEFCQSPCLKSNYGLAGLENGDICSCGNGLQSSSSTLSPDESRLCNTNCAGDLSETCGGADTSTGKTYLSVWNSTSVAIIPTFVQQVGAYPLLGCFFNPSTNHVLTVVAISHTDPAGMSVGGTASNSVFQTQ